MSKKLYIIAGCNGAGKTTASFTILPEILLCKEFINADEIAKGLSPFQPEKVSINAGRIMIHRINELIENGETFAFKTTLSTRSYHEKVKYAQSKGYKVTLFFFWLNTVELAIDRVKTRVSEGGHNIDREVIIRRYSKGIQNLFSIYIPLVDEFLVIDNSEAKYELIAEKNKESSLAILNLGKWNKLKQIA
jgi:predicted ABC-type ATPase